MIINFRARGISRGVRKLTRTPMLIIKKKNPTLKKLNPEGCSSTSQALGLLPRGHQFESHKPQSY